VRIAPIWAQCVMAVLTSLVIVSSVQGDERLPTIVLDSWWSEDFAKTTCEQALGWHKENRAVIPKVGCATVTACPETMPIVEACQPSFPIADVRDFEDRLITFMATNPTCKGVHIVRYSGPARENNVAASKATSGQHWTLLIDYVPGAKQQSWSLDRDPTETFTKGEGNPRSIAASVCAIVPGQGAKLD
jgi:hypothetical protein